MGSGKTSFKQKIDQTSEEANSGRNAVELTKATALAERSRSQEPRFGYAQRTA
jgi:hypothetical protein